MRLGITASCFVSSMALQNKVGALDLHHMALMAHIPPAPEPNKRVIRPHSLPP